MNRIYQGRVTAVQIQNPDKSARAMTPWVPLDPDPKLAKQKGEEALWDHHVLFQDAVNYFFAAFAAMVPADCSDASWRSFRQAIERIWGYYRGRKGAWEYPFGRVCSASGLRANSTFPEFRERLFTITGSAATDALRFEALKSLFSAVSKVCKEIVDLDESPDESIRGVAERLYGTCLVKLCAQKTGARDEVMQARQKTAAIGVLQKVKAGGTLAWSDVFFFKTKEGARPWTREVATRKIGKALREVSDELAERVAEFEKNPPKSEEGRARLAEFKSLDATLRAEMAAFEKWLCASSTILPSSEPLREGSGGYDMKTAMLLALRPDCAVFRQAFLYFNRQTDLPEIPTTDVFYAARRAGGLDVPVFPLFLDILSGRQKDATVGQGVWPDFEKAAFNEAYIKIGQFFTTGRKFELRLLESNETIAQFETELPINDALLSLQEVTDELSDGNPDERGLPRPYAIRDRTLKAWPRVRKEWLNRLSKDPAVDVSAEDLIEAKNRLQAKLREKFGSPALFDLLAQPHYRHIWQTSADALEKRAKYDDAVAEKKHLEAERVFTPANPESSPRYLRWSGTNAKEHLPLTESGPATSSAVFSVIVDAFDFARKETTALRLSFSAPRLLRDGLRAAGERLDKAQPDRVWVPPALRPVLIKHSLQPDKQTFAGTSVRLAPRNSGNIQLVFEPALENRTLPQQWGLLFPFAGYARDGIFEGLKWKTRSPRDPHPPEEWQNKGRLSCLSVDLGLTHAAAYHVLLADREHMGNSRRGLVHRLTPDDAKEHWGVHSIACGHVRLPGEDAWVWREIAEKEREHLKTESAKKTPDGFYRQWRKRNPSVDYAKAESAFLPELYGSAGRNASSGDSGETAEANAFFARLREFGDNFAERFPKGTGSLSFPQQNDELLFGLGRVRSLLFRLHRWAEHLYSDMPQAENAAVAEKLRVRAKKRRELVSTQIKALERDDPLFSLKDKAGTEFRTALESKATAALRLFRETLPKVADRVLPVRCGSWAWTERADGWYEMRLDETRPRRTALLGGQRGLSNARLRQLKELRQFAQSLNHLCRHKFVQRYVIPDRTIIPEPFEGCRKALEDARADRAKQIAHAIFASALGVELDHPPADKSGRRRRESLHGVYRCAERDPVNFIAIERLGNFRTSDRKSRRENRQLAEWRHREIHKVLKELCESVGLPIIEVDPAFTSRFSAKDHSVGFRAEEVFANDPRLPVWKRRAQTEPTWRVFISDLGRLPESKSLLLPKKGGPVFVSLAGLIAPHEKEPTHPADLSAAYRIGLRALAHPDRRELFGTVQLAIKASLRRNQAHDNSSAGKNRCFIIDVSGSLPGSQKRLDCPWSVAPNSEFLWEEINGSMAWTRCTQINAARLAKWRRDATVPGHPEL